MPRLIDADELIKAIPSTSVDVFENCRNCKLLDKEEIIYFIEKTPTVDAVEVVRCKDCEWKEVCEINFEYKGADGYCSKGKRKDDAKTDRC